MTTNRISIWTSIPATIVLGLTIGFTVVSCGSPQTPEAAAAAAAAAAPKVPVPSGTAITVHLDQSLSTDQNKSGDTFGATLDDAVVAGGADVIPKGTRFTGHVTTADTSGRLEGRGVLGITLDSFDLNGRTYPVVASLDTRTTEAHKKGNIELIGGGAGVGALIGAIAGGGKGAAIGAGIGAAGGTGVAAATGEKNVNVAAGTPFTFALTSPIEI